MLQRELKDLISTVASFHRANRTGTSWTKVTYFCETKCSSNAQNSMSLNLPGSISLFSHLCDTATFLHHALRNSHDIKFLQVLKLHLFPLTSTACSCMYKCSTVQLSMHGSVLRKIRFKKHILPNMHFKQFLPSLSPQAIDYWKKAHLYWTAVHRACDLQHCSS